MKWDEMSPRERDALVAERVIGWEPYATKHLDFLPHYTTNISAAWEVVQKLKLTHSFELRVGKFAESARFVQQLGFGDGSQFVAQLQTASESICKAALKAVGVDIE